MTSRRMTLLLILALVISVGLNLFAAAAGVTIWRRYAEIDRREDAGRTGERAGARDILSRLTPEGRRQARTIWRAAAKAARSDFEAARQARAAASAAASAPDLDASAVEALLLQSRQSESLGRAKMEKASMDILAALGPEDRRAFAPILKPRGRQGSSKDRRPPPSQ